MPARQRSSRSRAAARRRARLLAQGGEPPPEDEASATPPDQAAVPRPSGLFGRLFPPAPPLPGKGDPLSGFTYAGPAAARGLVSGAWLLARHPLYWGVAAGGWAALQLVLLFVGREDLSAFAITFTQYALLIGAGWVAWWRPWLFGAAAGVVGVLLQAFVFALMALQTGETPVAALAVFGNLTALGPLYALIGAFAGFYGGYLRRRMASAPSQRRRG